MLIMWPMELFMWMGTRCRPPCLKVLKLVLFLSLKMEREWQMGSIQIRKQLFQLSFLTLLRLYFSSLIWLSNNFLLIYINYKNINKLIMILKDFLIVSSFFQFRSILNVYLLSIYKWLYAKVFFWRVIVDIICRICQYVKLWTQGMDVIPNLRILFI